MEESSQYKLTPPFSKAVIDSVISYAQFELGMSINHSEIERVLNGTRPEGMSDRTYEELRFQAGFAINLEKSGCLEDPISHPEKFAKFLSRTRD
jgi:hypothetical protein